MILFNRKVYSKTSKTLAATAHFPSKKLLPAPATYNNHLLVVLQYHLVIHVQIKHGYRVELRRHATGFGYGNGGHRVHQRLYDGVVRRVQMVRQREPALPLTVEGVIARWRHDPIAPTDVSEIHVHLVPHTVSVVVFSPTSSSCGPFASLYSSGESSDIRRCVLSVVCVSIQYWLHIRPSSIVFVVEISFESDMVPFSLIQNRHHDTVVAVGLLDPPLNRFGKVQLQGGVFPGVHEFTLDHPLHWTVFALLTWLHDVFYDYSQVGVFLLVFG